jgi:hypothetical protein
LRSKAPPRPTTWYGLYAPRWRRQITPFELDRFEIVGAARGLSDDLVTAREKDFPNIAWRIFEHLKANWPKISPDQPVSGSVEAKVS